MRRARIQVRPNVAPRKAAAATPQSTTSSEKTPTSSPQPAVPALNPAAAEPQTVLPSETIAPSIPQTAAIFEKPLVAEAPAIAAEKSAPVQNASTASVPKHSASPGDNTAKQTTPSATGVPPVIRRSKIKPMVKVKPRIGAARNVPTKSEGVPTQADQIPKKPEDSTQASVEGNDSTSTGNSVQTGSGIPSSGDRPSQFQIVNENDGIISEPDETQFTSIKPRTGDVIKAGVVHSNLSGLSPCKTTINKISPIKTGSSALSPGKAGSLEENSKACVIQLDKTDETHLRNKTTVNVIKSEKLESSQNDTNVRDTTTVSVLKMDNVNGPEPATVVTAMGSQQQQMSQNAAASSIITKVVPARRHRLLKPRPNLTESAQHRKRSASMSASDTDEEFVKKHVHSAKHVLEPANKHVPDEHVSTNKHVPQGAENRATVDSPLVVTKVETPLDGSLDGSMVDEGGKQKSLFRIRAEREKERQSAIERRPGRRAGTLEQPVDRTSMRICDLIYYNPTKNRMKSSVLEEEKRKKQTEDIIGKVADNTPIEAAPEPPPADNNNTPVLPLPKSPEPTLVSEDEEPIMVPQVTIGADGQIVINEESLTVKQKTATIEEGDSEVIEEFSNTPYNAQLYYKRYNKTKTWSWRETKRFYLALSVVGTDFSLMTNLFQGRNRNDLKKKFKREEKSNRWLVDEALKNTKSYDISLFDQLSDTDDELEAKRVQEEQKKKMAAEKAAKAKEAKEESKDSKKPKGKPRPKKAKGRIVTYAQSSDSDTEKVNKQPNNDTHIKPDKKPVRRTNKKANSSQKAEENTDDGPVSQPAKPPAKRRSRAKRRTEGEKEEGAGPPKRRGGKNKKAQLNTSVASDIANLSSGQVLLLSEGGQNAGPQNGQGEMIHMYVLSPDPQQRAGASTPGNSSIVSCSSNIAHSPRVLTSPNIVHPPRVHRDSINEALNMDPNESNPFASFMAQKLPNMMAAKNAEPPTKRSRKDSNTSVGLVAGLKRQREQESQKMMMDLTLFGRETTVHRVENHPLYPVEAETGRKLSADSQTGHTTEMLPRTPARDQETLGLVPEMVQNTGNASIMGVPQTSSAPEIVSIMRLPEPGLSQQTVGIKTEKEFSQKQVSNPNEMNIQHNNEAVSLQHPVTALANQSFVSMITDNSDQYTEVLDLTKPVRPAHELMTSSYLGHVSTNEMRASPMNLTMPKSTLRHSPVNLSVPNTMQQRFIPVSNPNPMVSLSIPQPVFQIPEAQTQQILLSPNYEPFSPEVLNPAFSGQSILQGAQSFTPGVTPLQTVSQGTSQPVNQSQMAAQSVSQSQFSVQQVSQSQVGIQMNQSQLPAHIVSQSQLGIQVANQRPTIVTTAAVCLVPPETATIVTTASIRLVPPPAFMAVSTPRTSQASNPDHFMPPPPTFVIGRDGNLVNFSPIVDSGAMAQNQNPNIPHSGSGSAMTDSIKTEVVTKWDTNDKQDQIQDRKGLPVTSNASKHVPDKFSHLSPLRRKTPEQTIAAAPLRNAPATVTSLPQPSTSGSSPARKSHVLPAPSQFTNIRIPLQQKSNPSPGLVPELSQRNTSSTRLPSATFIPDEFVSKFSLKEKSTKGKAKVKRAGEKKMAAKKKATVQSTRLPAATFGSDEDELKTRLDDDVDDEEEANQSPPIEWLENSTRDSGDSDQDNVPTIKIRILKTTDKPPEKGDASSGEINLFVG